VELEATNGEPIGLMAAIRSEWPSCHHTVPSSMLQSLRDAKTTQRRMTDQAAVDWPTCDESGCIGIRLPPGSKCLAHATARRRAVALRQLHQTGEIDARGIPITAALLEDILAAAPHHPTFATARFDQATFRANAGFEQATFRGDAWFHRPISEATPGSMRRPSRATPGSAG
jgi:hypothetical protein